MAQYKKKKINKNIGNEIELPSTKASNDVASSKIKKRSKQCPEEYGRKLHLLEWLPLDMR